MRKPRKLRDSAKYHVIARANLGEFILEEKNIKQLFIDTVQRAKKKYIFRIINFCIMDNHVHLIIRPGKKESLSKIMQWILSVFAINYNNIYKLKGHVWYDRFKSIIINSIKQLLDTFHYISNNPVKADLVLKASQYAYNGITFILQKKFTIIKKPPNIFMQPYLD